MAHIHMYMYTKQVFVLIIDHISETEIIYGVLVYLFDVFHDTDIHSVCVCLGIVNLWAYKLFLITATLRIIGNICFSFIFSC